MGKPCCGNAENMDRKRFFLWLPGLGWNLASGGEAVADMAILAGSGLGLDKSGRLYVNWSLLPEKLVLDCVAAHLGNGLEFENGLLSLRMEDIELPDFPVAEIESVAGRLSLAKNSIAGQAARLAVFQGELADAASCAADALEIAQGAEKLAHEAKTSAIADLLGFQENCEERLSDLDKYDDHLDRRIDELLDKHDQDILETGEAIEQLAERLEDCATSAEMNAALAEKAGNAAATRSENGLMSADDKIKLDGIQAGAQANPTLPTVASLFPVFNANPGFLAVFNANHVNAGFLRINEAKALFATDLSGCVLKNADSTITGALTVTKSLDSTNTYPFQTRNADVDIRVNPAATIYKSFIRSLDKNGSVMANLRWYQSNAGTLVTEMYSANQTAAGVGVNALLSVRAFRDGSLDATCPAPPAASNGNEVIATCGWTRARIASATGFPPWGGVFIGMNDISSVPGSFLVFNRAPVNIAVRNEIIQNQAVFTHKA